MVRHRVGMSTSRRASLPADPSYIHEILATRAPRTSLAPVGENKSNRFAVLSRSPNGNNSRDGLGSPLSPSRAHNNGGRSHKRNLASGTTSVRGKELFLSLRKRYTDNTHANGSSGNNANADSIAENDEFNGSIPATFEDAVATTTSPAKPNNSARRLSTASSATTPTSSPSLSPSNTTHTNHNNNSSVHNNAGISTRPRTERAQLSTAATATAPVMTVPEPLAAVTAPQTGLMQRLFSLVRWPFTVLGDYRTGRALRLAPAAAAATVGGTGSAAPAVVGSGVVTADTHRIRRLRSRVTALETKLEELQSTIANLASNRNGSAGYSSHIPPAPVFSSGSHMSGPPAPVGVGAPPPPPMFDLFGDDFSLPTPAPVEKTWNLNKGNNNNNASKSSAAAKSTGPLVTVEALRSIKLKSAAERTVGAGAFPATPSKFEGGPLVSLEQLRTVKLRKVQPRTAAGANGEGDCAQAPLTPAQEAARARAAKSSGSVFIPTLRDITGVKLRSTAMLRSPGKTPHKAKLKSPEQAAMNPIMLLRRRMLGSPRTRATLKQRESEHSSKQDADEDDFAAASKGADVINAPATATAAAAAASEGGEATSSGQAAATVLGSPSGFATSHVKRAKAASPSANSIADSVVVADANDENSVVFLSPPRVRENSKTAALSAQSKLSVNSNNGSGSGRKRAVLGEVTSASKNIRAVDFSFA